jgi:hypothetical protein
MMSDNGERVNWEDAASAGNDASGNGDVYDGEVAWDSAVKEVRGARFAVREIIRIVVRAWSWAFPGTTARKPPGILRSVIVGVCRSVAELLVVACAYAGLIGLMILWIVGCVFVVSLPVHCLIRAILFFLVFPLFPLCFAPMYWLSVHDHG